MTAQIGAAHPTAAKKDTLSSATLTCYIVKQPQFTECRTIYDFQTDFLQT